MLHPTMKIICEYVVQAYSFLIPLGSTLSGEEYAALIAQRYDTTNPAIGCDCEIAKRYIASITHGAGDDTKATFNN